MADTPRLPPLLRAALELREKTDLSRLFLPAMTNNLPNNQPLWQVMQKAHDATIAINHPFATNEQLRAAEILAVRDWILQLPNGYDWPKMQAKALANVLTAQADFAERTERSDD